MSSFTQDSTTRTRQRVYRHPDGRDRITYRMDCSPGCNFRGCDSRAGKHI